jgi:hypothetical protein
MIEDILIPEKPSIRNSIMTSVKGFYVQGSGFKVLGRVSGKIKFRGLIKKVCIIKTQGHC